jgi:hypothetical protein
MVIKLLSGFNSVFPAAVLILCVMNVFVLAILFYLLYRFIGGFLIPLYRTTRHMRQQFHNMNNQANGQQANNTSNPGGPAEHSGTKTGSSKVGEYIDFEEVK